MKAKDLTLKRERGDIVTLNCGFGGGPDETDCLIIAKPYDSKGLFGGMVRNFPVRIMGTHNTFTTSLPVR
jgi:hypothetical protein